MTPGELRYPNMFSSVLIKSPEWSWRSGGYNHRSV